VDLPVKAAPGRRQRKAQVTRARVLDSAEALFIRDGYAATTITAIAEEADVAVQTVYAVFGNKRAILTELLAARVVGDDKPAPLRERRDWQALEAEADPVRQLELLAWTAARIGSRIADLYVVMAAAAASDPEIRPAAPSPIAGAEKRTASRTYADPRDRHHLDAGQPAHLPDPGERTRLEPR
jgi:AcrR family transcriptional regulator